VTADQTPTDLERGLLLAVLAPGVDDEEELGEMRELARTAGVEPVGAVVQHRAHPAPRTFVGKGKIEELKQAYKELRAESLIVDGELDPAQQRYLENALDARVVDRAQLILDIFAQHAVSAEGKLQVELAQLEYNLPRMRGAWKHLERLGGGRGTLGAGVGTRGPGESQLESDRRMARRRISILRRRLQGISRTRATQRKERKRTAIPTVALAGYTNVGKSTLLNALTDAQVSVENRLFETLDPTTRGFEHDGRRYLVTDTVGFIRRLPHQLVEGFASTLEETLVADLVLHVADASQDEARLIEQLEAVDAVLAEIGAAELPSILVLNKVDRLDPLARRRLGNRFPDGLQVSALAGTGLDELRERIAEHFAERFEEVRLLVPYEDGAKLAELYALGAPKQRECSSGRVCRTVTSSGSRRTSSPSRGASRSSAERRAADPPAATRRRSAATRLPRRRGPRPVRVRTRRPRARGTGDGRHRPRRRDSRRLRRLRPAALRTGRQARHHDRQRAGPRRLGLPRRGDGGAVEHGRHGRVRGRAGDAHRTARPHGGA
jgi:GTP-binding protein HflX